MDVKDSANKGSEGSEERGRENVCHLRGCLNHWEQTDTEDASGKGSEGCQEQVIGNWRRADYYDNVSCSDVESRLVNDEPGC